MELFDKFKKGNPGAKAENRTPAAPRNSRTRMGKVLPFTRNPAG